MTRLHVILPNDIDDPAMPSGGNHYDRRVLDALGLAPNERIAGFVHIGRPVKPSEDRPRPPLNEIVTRYNAN